MQNPFRARSSAFAPSSTHASASHRLHRHRCSPLSIRLSTIHHPSVHRPPSTVHHRPPPAPASYRYHSRRHGTRNVFLVLAVCQLPPPHTPHVVCDPYHRAASAAAAVVEPVCSSWVAGGGGAASLQEVCLVVCGGRATPLKLTHSGDVFLHRAWDLFPKQRLRLGVLT